MPGLLTDKVALVTGAGAGIGRATALAMARAGAQVVLADIDEANLEQATRDVNAANSGAAVAVRTDVSREDDVNAMLDFVLAKHGRLDCAFNNAGIEGAPAPSGRLTLDEWDRVIGINLTGVWLCLRAEINIMKQSGGAIVNTASVAGLVGLKQSAAYIAAKHGVVGLTRSAAMDYGKYNIRVNTVCPGFIETPMTDRVFSGTDGGLDMALRWQMLQKTGTPSHIADAVCWLCSSAAEFVTGVALPVDAGYTAR